MTAKTTILGYPRIGLQRELKKAQEAYWKGNMSREELLQCGREIREANWRRQQAAGLDWMVCNDFSFYDHVLDMACLLGCLPERFAGEDPTDVDTMFYVARGHMLNKSPKPAAEMTKWFDTNYHYIVPEFHRDTRFSATRGKIFDEWNQARSLGLNARPVLVGPLTFLLSGKIKDEGLTYEELSEPLLEAYVSLLTLLKDEGVAWVQMDEPMFSRGPLPAAWRQRVKQMYETLAEAVPQIKILLANYFGGLRENLDVFFSCPAAGYHVDLVRGRAEWERITQSLPQGALLSAGVVDGRNVWAVDRIDAGALLKALAGRIGKDRLVVAASCSLLHVPITVEAETELSDELKTILAFADEKIKELRALADDLQAASVSSSETVSVQPAQRLLAPWARNEAVQKRVSSLKEQDFKRSVPYADREDRQRKHLNLPLLPTTTIGSFPQTSEVRRQRAAYRKGAITQQDYERFVKGQIDEVIRIQEEIGLDVLVHGEFERNDMVEYFGEWFDGMAVTRNGWVQSYGSRCVKPPIIYGDVARPRPFTVHWIAYAQSKTNKPVKGMLTGPVTIAQWSFVRDDQPRRDTVYQIALALREEVADLESAGIKIIQIDEPALREGLPLHPDDRDEYLDWAVKAFRLAGSCVAPETQIHTHMCYSEFNDILPSIIALDADVISIEAARSGFELLEALKQYGYPAQIGPGVYDIHSPRIPSQEEIVDLIGRILAILPARQVWVNPDCGLKTRSWDEVKPSLSNMVAAAKEWRQRLARAQAGAEV